MPISKPYEEMSFTVHGMKETTIRNMCMRIVSITLFIMLFSGFIACGSGGGSGGGERIKERLRIVHAAPSLGVITVLQDGIPIGKGLSYGNSLDYFEIEEGKSKFTVRVDPEFVLPTSSTEEEVTGPYKKTLLITETSGTPVLTFIADQTDTPVPDGESRIRFLNAAAQAGAVDVYITAPSTPLSGRTAVATGLAEKSVTDYFPAEPGEYRIRIAGSSSGSGATSSAASSASSGSSGSSGSPSGPNVIYDSRTYAIESGEEITFMLLEKRGGGKPYRGLSLR